MTQIQMPLAAAGDEKPRTQNITEAQLCAAYGISRTTLYRYFTPDGQLRPKELKLLMDDDDGGVEIAVPMAGLVVKEDSGGRSLIHQYRFLLASLGILAFDAIVNGLLVVHHMKPAVVNLYLPGLFGVILISSMFVPRDKSLLARLRWALLIPGDRLADQLYRCCRCCSGTSFGMFRDRRKRDGAVADRGDDHAACNCKSLANFAASDLVLRNRLFPVSHVSAFRSATATSA